MVYAELVLLFQQRPKLRELADNPTVNFVLEIGTRRLIKRKQFEQYLENKRYL